ncbi:MAG: 2-C-methyl-D-erythritol 4-phosphate cytidylyltransferase [Lachnospiraceae bacterium]
MSERIGAVILAGGKGSRMESDIQKQYMLLNGRPLITYALDAFEASQVDDIILVAGEAELEYVHSEIVQAYGYSKVSAVVAGGQERYHSVYSGLQAMKGCSYVLIHDGARPLVTSDIISRAIDGARGYQACVIGMPVKDTIKVSDSEAYGIETPDRNYLWQIQTPQAFSYPLIRGAYDWLMDHKEQQSGVTDDAMVLEKYTGDPVKLIQGSYTNLKVTTPEDLHIAEVFIGFEKKLKNI